MSKKPLYIHIPFCDHICAYCDFVRVGNNSNLADRYILELRKDLLALDYPISTIYIGGGTPSALTIDQLQLLFDSLPTCDEITFEANPESLNLEKIKLLKKYNVKRLSLGVQSTQATFLNALGRKHNYQDVLNVFDQCHAIGINNISLDLIYGVPHQSINHLKIDLDNIIQLKPNHVSLYSLTIEPNSEFGRNNVKEVDPQLETEMYLMITEELEKNGYIHYEISNFCLPGFQSQHNLSYWNYEDFIGLGIGAAGKENNQRYINDANLNYYLNGERRLKETIELSKQDQIFEHLMMSLRLKEGLNINQFNCIHQIDLLDYYALQINKFIQNGLLIIQEDYLFASDEGRLMLHDILIEFME